jgi:hypothetical protein
MAQIRGMLEALSASFKLSLPPGSPVTGNEWLQQHASHYTMQAERDVHRAVLTPEADTGGTNAATEVGPSQQGQFGDNVELF